jgi:hypothetical protein
MKSIVASLFILVVLSFSVFSQVKSSDLKTFELGVDRGTGCFSFITESVSCGRGADLSFGRSPESRKVSWFRASGEGTRNKIESLGKKDWTNDFKVPVLEPYAKLRPGLQRDPFLNASATRGGSLSTSQGAANNGGASKFDERTKTFSDAKSSSGLPGLRGNAKSDYFPFEKVVLGNMYVMRVVDENNDFYVLFRVDELERGKRAKISWKRIPAPQED